MSDETQAAAAAQPNAAENAPDVQVRAQFIRDVSFEAPNGPLPLVGAKSQPNINVQMNVRHRPIQGIGYEVVLALKAESKLGEQALFLCEVDYAALVSLKEGLDEERTKECLLVEVPRLLFPYSRRTAADLVQEGGFPPLVLNPVDFKQFAANATVVEPGQTPGDATIQ